LIDACEIDARLANSETDFWNGRFAFLLPTVRLEENRRRDLPMQPSLPHRVRGLLVEAQRVSLGAARYVRGHRTFEALLPELLEDGGAEERIIDRRGPKRDERILFATSVPILVRPCDPEREETKHSTGLLESRERSPLALKHRQRDRMERVGD
jgi:hypothetical protein